jgi:hypothetical protein
MGFHVQQELQLVTTESRKIWKYSAIDNNMEIANLRIGPLALSCVCPYGETRLLLNGFLENFIFQYSSKIRRENSIFIKILQEQLYFTWRPTYISELFLEW